MYETKIDIFNKLREEKRVKDICNRLNNTVRSILDIDPRFTYLGSKEDEYFTIYNENKYDNGLSINLTFSLHYPDKSSFLDNKETRDLDDEEFAKYIEYKYNQSKLFCAEINFFSISPKGKGYGTKIIHELIDILKIIESIEMILLQPKDNNAREFWIRNNFIKYKGYDKRLNTYISDNMIYRYPHCI